MIDRANVKDIYGLSAMQKSMLIAYMKDESTNAYIEQFSFPLYGAVDPLCMQEAMNMLIMHYDIFRTVFTYKSNENPYQVVLKQYELNLEVIDLSGESNPGEQFQRLKDEDQKRGFSLSSEILIRGTLYKIAEEEWRFLFTFHHIILDGWSLGNVFSTLFTYYKMIYDKVEIKQGTETVPYKNYIKWLEAQDETQAKEYWEKYLLGFEMDTGIIRFAQENTDARVSYQFTLDQNLYERMKNVASTRGLTLNIIFQAAWASILQKYNHTNDVVFGNVVSGRAINLTNVDKMSGLLINTQPLRVISEKTTSFVDVCKQIQCSMLDASPYEFYPLYKIQSTTSLKNRLLDHAIAFENYPLEDYVKEVELADGKIIGFGSAEVREQATYDLHIIVNPGKDFKVTFTYNSGVYCNWQMESLGRSIINVLEQICENPEITMNAISICDEMQKAELLSYEEGKTVVYDKTLSVIDCFSTHVRDKNQKDAIVFDDQRYTYEEVERWSNVILKELQEEGVTKGDHVGVFMGRSPEAVIAMLAILKAGALYVPLNTKESDERLQFIIEDASMKSICVTEETKERCKKKVGMVTVEASQKNEEGVNTYEKVTGKDGAYILYTSGTTGKPKGCVVTHKNILRTVQNQDFIPFSSEDMVLQTASIAFDPSVVEIWGALCNGGTLVIVNEQDLLDARAMKRIISENKITSMQLTTPLFNRLVEEDPSIFEGVKNLMIGGDVLHKKFVEKVFDVNETIHLINGYGPTENTVVSTTNVIDRNHMSREKISIGKPLNNSYAYVMDEARNLLPIGAKGELCVGGDGLSDCYLNQPELTEKKYVDHPWKTAEKMYCTGDQVMLLPDGTVEFIGRIDTQVKVNGYRIEVGEIEHQMNRLEGVKDSVVTVEEYKDMKYICAFYVAERELDIQETKRALQASLPSYMIPVYYQRVDQFEMTPNGKVNRKILHIDIASRNPVEKLVFASAIEKQLVEIIQQTTGISVVKTDENLFDLGITSLNLMAIRNKLNKDLNYDIALSVLFEKTTVSTLAKYIETMNHANVQEVQTKETKVEVKVMKNGIRKLRQETEEDW